MGFIWRSRQKKVPIGACVRQSYCSGSGLHMCMRATQAVCALSAMRRRHQFGAKAFVSSVYFCWLLESQEQRSQAVLTSSRTGQFRGTEERACRNVVDGIFRSKKHCRSARTNSITFVELKVQEQGKPPAIRGSGWTRGKADGREQPMTIELTVDDSDASRQMRWRLKETMAELSSDMSVTKT